MAVLSTRLPPPGRRVEDLLTERINPALAGFFVSEQLDMRRQKDLKDPFYNSFEISHL